MLIPAPTGFVLPTQVDLRQQRLKSFPRHREGHLPRSLSGIASFGHRSPKPASSRQHASAVSPFVLGPVACVAAWAAARRQRSSCQKQRSSATVAHVAITGPGWTDEVARIFDSRYDGPEWEEQLGYRGRPRLRLLLDGEDIAHSYAKAKYDLTGKWTGPLSEGIIKALLYGAWAGGDPENRDKEDRGPMDPQFTSPEVMTFVGLPADLIEATKPEVLIDGYPEALRKDLGYVELSEDGLFINDFLRSLQDDNRLLTWNRPSRLHGGGIFRPSTLINQKYYRQGSPEVFKDLYTRPVLLSQVMGAGTSLKVGDRIEALRPGSITKRNFWIPSKWEKATVMATNYDGTYDIKFEMNFGPYRENKKRGLKGTPRLSLSRHDRFLYKTWGADDMPAEFRLMQEMSYMQGYPPSQIRMPGMLDRVADTMDTEGAQNWFLCSSKNYQMSSVAYVTREISDARASFQEYKKRFQFDYRWVPTEDGKDLRFEPLPNSEQANALNAVHRQTGGQFETVKQVDGIYQRQLDQMKEQLEKQVAAVEQVPAIKPDKPRPAAPKPHVEQKMKVQDPVRVRPKEAGKTRRRFKSIAGDILKSPEPPGPPTKEDLKMDYQRFKRKFRKSKNSDWTPPKKPESGDTVISPIIYE
eukprot:TRINITY_DN79448_c0_g1_i1.p1 TRINITY_DN79448_c0_g1~~TRINITY_DN79448_c0_g1_i1.p1  ORF type:complete len:639 (+),score=87.14 TRINITY_DN79448_c0_g1_i1:136-2052(+)